MADYKWKPIEDLPEDWTKLASSELTGLASVWREHYETVKDGKALKQFNERLRREWAIETGIIENLYEIDNDTTQLLIEKGIEASLLSHYSVNISAEIIVPLLKDQERVVAGLTDFVRQNRQLSGSYIKQLHQALTQHQQVTEAIDSLDQAIQIPLLQGEWKKLPNNPLKPDGTIHHYCPPLQVESEIGYLIELHLKHLKDNCPPEIEAAWLHHRFVQIHPFQDGNGRVARALASLIFLRAGLFPLVIHRSEKNDYLDALEMADRGNLNLLVQCFSRAQKNAIDQAIELYNQALQESASLEDVIAMAVDRLRERKKDAFIGADFAAKLKVLATNKLESIAIILRNQMQSIDEGFDALVVTYFDKLERVPLYGATRDIAEEVGYLPNFPAHSSWLALRMEAPRITDLVLSFHGCGDPFNGTMAVSAFFPPHYATVEDNVTIVPTKNLSDEVFQFNAGEPKTDVTERFYVWLDKVILDGLNHWRQQL